MKRLSVEFCATRKAALLLCAFVAVCFALISCHTKSAEAEKLYVSAVESYAKQDLDAALNFTEMAIKCDKNFYAAEFLLSKIYFFQGDYAASQKRAARLVKRHPEFTDARLHLIRCLVLSGAFDEAETLLAKELSFNASDWRAHYLYSLLALRRGDMDAQLVMLSRAETALRDSEKVYANFAAAWEYLGLPEKARTYSVKAMILADGIADFENARAGD